MATSERAERSQTERAFRFRAYTPAVATNSTSSRPRRKPLTACTSCRLRKLRCSGDRPQCTNCPLYHAECQYASPEEAVAVPLSGPNGSPIVPSRELTPASTSSTSSSGSASASPRLDVTQLPLAVRRSSWTQLGLATPPNLVPALRPPPGPSPFASIATIRVSSDSFGQIVDQAAGCPGKSTALAPQGQMFIGRAIHGAFRLSLCFPCFSTEEAQHLLHVIQRSATPTPMQTFCALAMSSLIECTDPFECNGWSKSCANTAKQMAPLCINAVSQSSEAPGMVEARILVAAGLGYLAVYSMNIQSPCKESHQWLRLAAQITQELPVTCPERGRLSRYLFFWDLVLRYSRDPDGTRDVVCFNSAVGHELIGGVLSAHRATRAASAAAGSPGPPSGTSIYVNLVDSIVALCLDLRFPPTSHPYEALAALDRWYESLPNPFREDGSPQSRSRQSTSPIECENYGLAIALRLMYFILRFQFAPPTGEAKFHVRRPAAVHAVNQIVLLSNFVHQNHKVAYWWPLVQTTTVLQNALKDVEVLSEDRVELGGRLHGMVRAAIHGVAADIGSPTEQRYLATMHKLQAACSEHVSDT